jgi:dienelactone hydrolase
MKSLDARISCVVLWICLCSASLADEKPPTQAVLEYLGNRASRMAEKTVPSVPGDVQTWEQRRKQVRESLATVLGLPVRAAMQATVTAQREEDNLVIEEVTYLWAERAYATAKVVRARSAKGRLPAIVSPPGWLGTLEDGLYKPWVRHMAGKGYLVLFIDDPHVGRRQAGHAALYGLASAAGTPVMGVQVFDTLRGLDYLLTRPDVDPGRIGVSGLCQGSEQTWLAAALEDRFQVAVPVCGTTSYEWWARMPHFLGVALGDASPYVENVLRHTDWDEIDACIAPRPVLIASNTGDNWWPRPGFDNVVNRLKETYQLYGQPGRFSVVFDLRSHNMTPYTPEIAAWFDRYLLPLPKSDATPQPCGEPKDPDTSMVRHFQRQIAAQTAALPQSFPSADAWNAYRAEMLGWLRRACAVEELKLGAARLAGKKTENGVVTQTVYVPQDDGFACPVLLYRKEGGPERPLPAVILSHHGGGCIADEGVRGVVGGLVEEGWLVAVPEHAGMAKGSLREANSNGLISLYGVGDSVGLPPIAMRVWDDLSCVGYLSSRPDVDKRRILAVGMGVGGVDAAIAAALDQRIAGAGLIGVNTVQDWAAHVAPALHPFDDVMPYLPSITTKLDLQHVYAAVAPRPLLLVDGTDREHWPASGFQRASKMAEIVYGLSGARGQLTAVAARSPWGIEELRAWLKSTRNEINAE